MILDSRSFACDPHWFMAANEELFTLYETQELSHSLPNQSRAAWQSLK